MLLALPFSFDDDFQDLIAGTFNPATLQDKPARVIRVFLSCTATGKFTRRAVLSCSASRVVHVHIDRKVRDVPLGDVRHSYLWGRTYFLT